MADATDPLQLAMPGMVPALRSAGSTRRWRRLRAFVLDRDGRRCRVTVDPASRMPSDVDGAVECGALASHVDHIVRRRDGGSDHPANLRAACASCNQLRESAPTATRSTSTTSAGSWAW